MSVVFDVLDSLYSIRNVDDLKKRWAEDCKRPQTLSYKAVEQFCGQVYADRDSDCIYAANFALRYREAVEKSICHPEDQAWIMPYVRFAENSKSGSWLTRRFDDVCFVFDAVEELEKEPLRIKKRHCNAIVKFFAAIEDSFAGNDIDGLMMALDSPTDCNFFNPWELNPEYPDNWNEEDCDSFDPFCNLMYHLNEAYNSNAEVWNYRANFWKILENTIEQLETDSQEYMQICDMVSNSLKEIKNANSRFQLAMDEYRHFKEVKNLLNNDDLSVSDKLNKIALLGFPCGYGIKLTYLVEPLIIEYIKSTHQDNLPHDELINLFEQIKSFKHIIANDLFKWLSTVFFSVAIYEAAIREDERKKVLFEMSHSIKNLVASVSEPLVMLQDALSGAQRRTVENALAGAGLIRDLAVGVHMSMRGNIGAWRKDVKEPGFGAATLDKIILDAMRHAVSNMFDGKYFSLFVRNYFGRDLETFMQAQNEWKAAVSAEETFACINKYFFDFTIDSHGADLKIPVGDRDGTATKLLILFQELFLNAVKYSSFTERGKRFMKLDVTITADKWDISISNSAVDRGNVKSSGIGLSVIKNFAALFEATYNATFAADIYTTTMKFFLNK